jgi:peptidyl-prolyl cis-trans isomerase SurA
MTLSVPTSRVLLAGFVLSALSAVTPVLSAQTTSAQAAKTAAANAAFQPNAPASPFNGTVVEDIVARVNDQIITKSDYQRAADQMDADARQQGWSEEELAERKKELLRDLIDKELLLSKGKELGITGETELVKRLDEIRKQNHLDSMEDLEKAAQQQGVSYEDFKQNIRNEIISREVIQNEVSRRIQLTKADIARYYRAHQADFVQPETVHLDEILIPVAADDPAALSAAQAKAADVEAQLKAGASFDELAKKDSAGQTASSGGDLGDYKRGQLAKPIEDATFALKAGEVTAPIRTKQGLLILKVTQHVGGSSQDFASIEPQVEEAAFMARMQPELRTYLNTLRSDAYIDLRPGYVDAGGSGNSVKPLYSAYTPPGAKKKKPKVQRARYREAAHAFHKSNKSAAKQQATATTGTTPAAKAPSSNAQVASNTTSSKPVKKEKVRFGQAPRGTLDSAPGNSTPAASGETQVASNVSTNAVPGLDPNANPSAKKVRTRFSDRAREPKQKKGPTQDQLENESQGQATPEEQATAATQAAPLGLAGDTATKKKQPKPKSDEKTRFADRAKEPAPKTDNAPAASTPDTHEPLDTNPAPTTNNAPPAPSTPQSSPQ